MSAVQCMSGGYLHNSVKKKATENLWKRAEVSQGLKQLMAIPGPHVSHMRTHNQCWL